MINTGLSYMNFHQVYVVYNNYIYLMPTLSQVLYLI